MNTESPLDDSGAQVKSRLHAALRDAMRGRDAAAMSALRGALGSIGNAEAVDTAQAAAAPSSPPGGPHFAGAIAGLGAAEVARRQLSTAQVEAIVAAEISERESAAGSYAAAARSPRPSGFAARFPCCCQSYRRPIRKASVEPARTSKHRPRRKYGIG
ncbi:MAG TPA: hypothetical protein VFQ44_00945 [Streptosporangiaceae bacterium]|nr:hypothetical protein [Streptosporangiaceae bacterium]